MHFLDTLVEVELYNSEDFLKIKETLSRIGIASKYNKTLYQTCHILHKRDKYYIVHFLEMFILDGRRNLTDFSERDKARRNTIALLLEEWGLLKIVNPEMVSTPTTSMKNIRVVPYKEKENWIFVQKYNIGKKVNSNV